MRVTPVIRLTAEARAELEAWRDRHPKPYLRERAAAVLKVADGWTMRRVAAFGLLRVRTEEAVAAWVRRFLQGGAQALAIRPGRGRKPAFSPSRPPRRRG